MVRRVLARLAGVRQSGRGKSRSGKVWIGAVGQSSLGASSRVLEWRGMVGQSRHGNHQQSERR